MIHIIMHINILLFEGLVVHDDVYFIIEWCWFTRYVWRPVGPGFRLTVCLSPSDFDQRTFLENGFGGAVAMPTAFSQIFIVFLFPVFTCCTYSFLD